jgi:diguanylate cyclase (GGDEF)-like protein
MANTAMRRPWELLVRHRFVIWDMTILLAAAAVLIVLGFEYDFLRLIGLSRADAAGIELGEALLIALLLGVFLLVTFRRMKARDVEVGRRIAAEEYARELAFQDPLTGLPNRRQFDDALSKAVAAPPGADRTHALILMDLNGFKSINDVFGHPTGDAVLREVGLRLKTIVRETSDPVARLGGDEFGIVASHLGGAESASGIALRIIAALRTPIRSGKTEHIVGVGIGIALFPADGNTAEEVMRRADIALYRAKSSHSDFRFFEASMDDQVRERAMVEKELRVGIANGDIQPYYQPTVDLGTGAIVGFEVLARWTHEILGNVPPGRFIPVAEDCGLICELSDHLLAAACRDARKWPNDMTLSFNVSPVQLRNSTFGLRVLAILGETGFPPNRLEIEITENTLVSDLNTAKMALGLLREAGVRIALDDFGTGYSSLYHLRNFKIDRIKIDRSFVESMSRESASAAVVQALLGLGHGLGVAVTAEGIENAEQREALISAGCDQGQGFLFSAAISAVEAQDLCDRTFRSLHNNKLKTQIAG